MSHQRSHTAKTMVLKFYKNMPAKVETEFFAIPGITTQPQMNAHSLQQTATILKQIQEKLSVLFYFFFHFQW